MAGELGKASLDLEANLTGFETNVKAAHGTSDDMRDSLEALAAVANIAERALNDVRMAPGQAAESKVSAEGILSGVRGVSDEAREAARELDHVRLTEAQAAESDVAGGLIDRMLNRISRNADQAKRKLAEVKLAGGVPGRSGVGAGPFGSGFGRVGLLGTAIGVGAITTPAAGPAAVGLLAGIPTLAAAGAGALGTLVLAFHGVGKAIGGDKKAFQELSPQAQKFVQTVRSLSGWLGKLRQTAGASLFPGLAAGLKSALSPGTVNAIFTAVVRLGRALGAAGAQWGRYFGSAQFQKIFGPLMQAGARTITVLSDAFLHLFDALGVVGRAAIPLMNWLTLAIDRGAKLADAWLRSKDASGALARGMNEAQTSLRLVGQLGLSLLRVVFALGRALYPVAEVAVKALTDGLNALSRIIDHNRGAIRTIVGTLITGLVGGVKIAARAVGLLVDGLGHIVSHKHAVIATIVAIGLAATAAAGPWTAIAVAAVLALGVIVQHWGTIVQFYRTLGREIINAFKWVWVNLEIAAIKAALKVVQPFSHLPSFLGGWARKAKKAMQFQLDKLHAPNMDWSAAAAQEGYGTGRAWRKGFLAGLPSQTKMDAEIYRREVEGKPLTAAQKRYKERELDYYAHGGKGNYKPPRARTRHHSEPAPGTHAWYMKYLGYDPTQTPTFGTPPPFTKGLGSKPSPIPARAAHLEALASQEASKAASAKTAKAAKEHLRKELADLEAADKILLAAYKKAHGAARTRLFNEITKVENKERTVRKQFAEVAKKQQQSQLDQLNLALDKAKLAVQHATVGTKAYAKAVGAEEKALKAEISYWDKRAHNLKLSAKKRDEALREELKYQKQLDALLKPSLKGVAENEAQFLKSFADILSAYAPNAFPDGSTGGGKTDTHLYDIKTEARRTNKHLSEIGKNSRFPATANGLAAAGAVGA